MCLGLNGAWDSMLDQERLSFINIFWDDGHLFSVSSYQLLIHDSRSAYLSCRFDYVAPGALALLFCLTAWSLGRTSSLAVLLRVVIACSAVPLQLMLSRKTERYTRMVVSVDSICNTFIVCLTALVGLVFRTLR